MLTLNFFLLVSTFGKLNCAGNGSSIKEHFSDVLSYLYPGVDVCGKIHDNYSTAGTCCTGMWNTYIYLFNIILFIKTYALHIQRWDEQWISQHIIFTYFNI
jgi:hypothetical protein